MATYIYETVPSNAGEKPKRFEIKQSMNDQPLTKQPVSRSAASFPAAWA